jgi:hypothetical protein
MGASLTGVGRTLRCSRRSDSRSCWGGRRMDSVRRNGAMRRSFVGRRAAFYGLSSSKTENCPRALRLPVGGQTLPASTSRRRQGASLSEVLHVPERLGEPLGPPGDLLSPSRVVG